LTSAVPSRILTLVQDAHLWPTGGLDVALCTDLRILSICSGTGQLDAGVGRVFPARRTVLYVEREAYAAAILVARMEAGDLDKAPIWSEARHLPTAALRGRVDLVVGGVPCQPFSRAGRRRGTDDERWLWPDLWRSLRALGATSLFLENVPGFAGHGLAQVAADLADAGWDAEWDVLPASEAGAQQIRPRFFLLGRAHGTRLPDPQPEREPGAAEGEREPGAAAGESGRPPVSDVRPPGRDAHRAWRALLAVRPWLSPAVECAVRGGVDGVAPGLDVCGCPRAARLRAVGNGAVPGHVELGLRTLLGRLQGAPQAVQLDLGLDVSPATSGGGRRVGT
jgi:DNA (cytosine-5)-methyltransferase 1